MNRHDVVALFLAAGAIAAIAAIGSNDHSWVAVAAFLVLTGLIVEVIGPPTDAERAYRRNHQAHRKGTKR